MVGLMLCVVTVGILVVLMITVLLLLIETVPCSLVVLVVTVKAPGEGSIVVG
jgi:hypothetical protein